MKVVAEPGQSSHASYLFNVLQIYFKLWYIKKTSKKKNDFAPSNKSQSIKAVLHTILVLYALCVVLDDTKYN